MNARSPALVEETRFGLTPEGISNPSPTTASGEKATGGAAFLALRLSYCGSRTRQALFYLCPKSGPELQQHPVTRAGETAYRPASSRKRERESWACRNPTTAHSRYTWRRAGSTTDP